MTVCYFMFCHATGWVLLLPYVLSCNRLGITVTLYPVMKAGWVLLFVTLCSVMQQAGYYCLLLYVLSCNRLGITVTLYPVMKAGWVLLFVTLCSVMQQAGYYCYLMFCHATGWVLLLLYILS